MSDAPQTPETPRQRLDREYEDPHYDDGDDVVPVEADEARLHSPKLPPRRKPAYRPLRRFDED